MKHILFFITCCLVFNTGSAQFHNIKMLDDYQGLRYIEEDDNGNLIISTTKNIYKCSAQNQQILWKYTFPDSVSFRFKVYRTDIYVLMNRNVSASFADYIILSKLNTNGNVVWSKAIHGSGDLSCLVLHITPQNKIYIGSTACAYQCYVSSFDTAGHPLSSISYPENVSGSASSIVGIKDDGLGNAFVFAIMGFGSSTYHTAVGVFKINSSGAVVWNKAYQVPFATAGFSTPSVSMMDSQKNMYLAVNISDSVYNSYNTFVKVDSAGTLKWCKVYAHLNWPGHASTNDFDLDSLQNIIAAERFTDTSAVLHWSAVMTINRADGSVNSAVANTSDIYSLFAIEYLNTHQAALGGYAPAPTLQASTGSGRVCAISARCRSRLPTFHR